MEPINLKVRPRTLILPQGSVIKTINYDLDQEDTF